MGDCIALFKVFFIDLELFTVWFFTAAIDFM